MKTNGLCTAPTLADHLLSRRELLTRSGLGFGGLSLAALTAFGALPSLPGQAAEVNANSPLAPKKPHFPAKA